MVMGSTFYDKLCAESIKKLPLWKGQKVLYNSSNKGVRQGMHITMGEIP